MKRGVPNFKLLKKWTLGENFGQFWWWGVEMMDIGTGSFNLRSFVVVVVVWVEKCCMWGTLFFLRSEFTVDD